MACEPESAAKLTRSQDFGKRVPRHQEELSQGGTVLKPIPIQ
jgi:hypothetical protein